MRVLFVTLFLAGCQTVDKGGAVILFTQIGPIQCERYTVTGCGANFYECGPDKTAQQLCVSGQVMNVGRMMPLEMQQPRTRPQSQENY